MVKARIRFQDKFFLVWEKYLQVGLQLCSRFYEHLALRKLAGLKKVQHLRTVQQASLLMNRHVWLAVEMRHDIDIRHCPKTLSYTLQVDDLLLI